MGELRFKDGELLFVGGELAMHEDCCCEEADCCAEVGGPPIADFSYTQTDDDPCTIDLHDESTPGSCGEIVSWVWKVNGSTVSTSQDPTDITVADGDDITLEVTDSEGCTDSAVMEVDCETFIDDCGCCTDELPRSVTVIASGWTNSGCGSGNCPDHNGTHNLPYFGTFSGACGYRKVLSSTNCGGIGNMDIEAGICGSPALKVHFRTDSAVIWTFAKALTTPGLCRGTHILNFTGVEFPSSQCGHPTSITLII